MRMRYGWMILWVFGLLVLPAGTTLGQDYLNQRRDLAAPPQSSTERFTFTLVKTSAYPHLDLSIQMTQGRADLRILDPAGRLLEGPGARECTVSGPIPGATSPGAYTVELTTAQAIGQWHVRIYGGPAPVKPPMGGVLVSSALMMLVAAASVGLWRWRSGVAWRWFWVGAAVWTVAVCVKFAIAIPLNRPVLEGLKASLPYWLYFSIGVTYGGLMTGITEVLFTFIAALVWRQMAANAARGVAIGVGAGAFEAALLATAAVIATAAGVGGGGAAWPVVLVPALERVIAILGHAASRSLVLVAVARRQWILFWYGFLLLSGVDAVAMIFYITGTVHTISPWMIEAVLVPFGLISIPITIWCIHRWPGEAEAGRGSATVQSADAGPHQPEKKE